MNKKLIPACAFGIAVLLAGSLAYAAERRKSTRGTGRPDNQVKEEESLRAELLDQPLHQQKKAPVPDVSKQMASLLADDRMSSASTFLTPAPEKK